MSRTTHHPVSLVRSNVAAARLLLFILSIPACDDALEVYGPYQERLVIYGILSTASDTQFVRIYRTYERPSDASSGSEVRGASVEVTTDARRIVFHDTTIIRADDNGRLIALHAYVAYDARIQAGRRYALSIRTPAGESVNATAGIPGLGEASVQNLNALQNPARTTDDIWINFRLGSECFGFLARLFVEYEHGVGGNRVTERMEIPTSFRRYGSCTDFEAEYPTLQRRGDIRDPRAMSTFRNEIYQRMLRHIVETRNDVRFRRAIVELTQVERQLYSYYNVVNGFRDPFSIRTDEPDYSSFRGALGVFGGYVKQSFSFTMPEKPEIAVSCR